MTTLYIPRRCQLRNMLITLQLNIIIILICSLLHLVLTCMSLIIDFVLIWWSYTYFECNSRSKRALQIIQFREILWIDNIVLCWWFYITGKMHLRIQVASWCSISFWIEKSINNFWTMSRRLIKTRKYLTYLLIDRLIRLVLTLHVSTATTKKPFSAM